MDRVTYNPTVLFAEDDVDLSRMYSQGLVNRAIKVETAHDGVEALDKIDGGSFDIMLLDIMMPIKSGIDVVRELPESSDNMRVIILSNLAITDVPEDILGRADRYVVKAETTPSMLATVILGLAASL